MTWPAGQAFRRSTVSLVLNDRVDARIPEATRQRVLDAARELNYSRNAAARALVTGKTHRIGVLRSIRAAFWITAPTMAI